MPDATRVDGLGFTWLRKNDLLPKHIAEKKNDKFVRMCCQIGFMLKELENSLKRNPDWIRIRHEELCEDPILRFKALYDKCGMNWHDGVRDAILERNREGSGYAPVRDSSKEIGKWKGRFSAEETVIAKTIVDAFGLEQNI
jgi:hypothetical protein